MDRPRSPAPWCAAPRACASGVEPRVIALEDLTGRSENGAQDVARIGLEILRVPLVAGEELALDGDQVREAPVEEATRACQWGRSRARAARRGRGSARRSEERSSPRLLGLDSGNNGRCRAGTGPPGRGPRAGPAGRRSPGPGGSGARRRDRRGSAPRAEAGRPRKILVAKGMRGGPYGSVVPRSCPSTLGARLGCLGEATQIIPHTAIRRMAEPIWHVGCLSLRPFLLEFGEGLCYRSWVAGPPAHGKGAHGQSPESSARHPKTWAWARGSSRSTCTPAALPVRVSPLPHGSQSSGLTRGSRSGEWLMSSSHLRGASPPRDRNTDAETRRQIQ